jgi:hypothetical protein
MATAFHTGFEFSLLSRFRSPLTPVFAFVFPSPLVGGWFESVGMSRLSEMKELFGDEEQVQVVTLRVQPAVAEDVAPPANCWRRPVVSIGALAFAMVTLYVYVTPTLFRMDAASFSAARTDPNPRPHTAVPHAESLVGRRRKALEQDPGLTTSPLPQSDTLIGRRRQALEREARRTTALEPTGGVLELHQPASRPTPAPASAAATEQREPDPLLVAVSPDAPPSVADDPQWQALLSHPRAPTWNLAAARLAATDRESVFTDVPVATIALFGGAVSYLDAMNWQHLHTDQCLLPCGFIPAEKAGDIVHKSDATITIPEWQSRRAYGKHIFDRSKIRIGIHSETARSFPQMFAERELRSYTIVAAWQTREVQPSVL